MQQRIEEKKNTQGPSELQKNKFSNFGGKEAVSTDPGLEYNSEIQQSFKGSGSVIIGDRETQASSLKGTKCIKQAGSNGILDQEESGNYTNSIFGTSGSQAILDQSNGESGAKTEKPHSHKQFKIQKGAMIRGANSKATKPGVKNASLNSAGGKKAHQKKSVADKIQQLEDEVSQIYFESTDDVASIIDQQLESLQYIDIELAQRDKLKLELLSQVEEIKSDQLLQLPSNYEDVVERVSNEMIQQRTHHLIDRDIFGDHIPNEQDLRKSHSSNADWNRKIQSSEEYGPEDQSHSDSKSSGFEVPKNKFIDLINQKFKSTLYSFKKRPAFEDQQQFSETQLGSQNEQENDVVRQKDPEIEAKLNKIREYDLKLIELEKQEKAIKFMIRQAKIDAKRQEEELLLNQVDSDEEQQVDVLSQSMLSSKSEKSASSQGSKMFMTQNNQKADQGHFKKKQVPQRQSGEAIVIRNVGPDQGRARKPIKLEPLGSSYLSSSSRSSQLSNSLSKSKKDFIALNIERAYLEEYQPMYISKFNAKQKARYSVLLQEIENNPSGPNAFKEQTITDYNQLYGELFGKIDGCGDRKTEGLIREIDDSVLSVDADILKCFSKNKNSVTTNATSKVLDKDLILEYKECQSRIREIDEKIYKLNTQDNQELMQLQEVNLAEFLALKKSDESLVREIKSRIDYSEIQKLEKLDEQLRDGVNKLDTEKSLGELQELQTMCEKASQHIQEVAIPLQSVEHNQRWNTAVQEVLKHCNTEFQQSGINEFYLTFLESDKILDEKSNRAESIKSQIENIGAMVEDESSILSTLLCEVQGLQAELNEIKKRPVESFEEDLEQELRQRYPDLFSVGSDEEGDEDVYLKYRHLNESQD